MNYRISLRIFCVVAFSLIIGSGANSVSAQGTAFTYQGKLTDSGNLANATYDMQFKLFDAATNGNQIGATLTFDGSGTNPPEVSVTSGLFAVTLDFGTCSPSTPCFNGSPRFLEIAVKPHGSGSYVTLTPRQPIASTPYAIKTTNLTFNGAYNDGTTVFTASNTFAGDGAGLNTAPDSNVANLAGKFNAFFGAGAGRVNTTGSLNAIFGTQAGQSNTTGSGNAFFGRSAGRDNVTGSGNAFFGTQAGQSNTTGNSNAFFGSAAGAANFSGINNSFFGNSAGSSNTNGTGNAFIGSSADFNIVGASGNNNTLLGSSTLVNSGVSNGTAIGFRASVTQSNSLILGGISGVNGGTDTNVGIGTTAPTERLHVVGNGLFTGNLTVNGTLTATLPAGSASYIQNNTSQQASSNFNISGTGTADIFNVNTQFNLDGTRVLSAANTNLFVGFGAGTAPNNTGSGNAFFGNQAGNANTTGFNNAFFGSQAGKANTTGNGNAFFGIVAGNANTSGNQNAIFGGFAGFFNTTGNNNAFFGYLTGQNNTTGGDNAFFGFQAGGGNSTANQNAFFGSHAGSANLFGIRNTFIGYGADFDANNFTGDNNTLLGASSRVTSGIINATAIGFRAQVAQDNSLVLGAISGINSCFTNCDSVKVGIGTTAPAALLDVQRDGGTIPETARFTTFGVSNLILGRSSNGTRTAPAATPSGRVMLQLGATGHDGTDFATTARASIQLTASENWTSTTQGTNIRFLTTVSGTTTTSTRLFIRDDGNVGIGSNVPDDKLEVNGDIRVGTGTTGCVKDADGTLIAGACSSDVRFKRDILPFPHLLDKVAQLQPVTFYWRSEEFKDRHFGSKPSFGLIAQEVEKVLPELVTEDEQGFKAVNYSKLPLLTLQAVKEMKSENDQLKQENAAIKQENQTIRQQQQVLQTQFQALKQVVCKSSPTADLCKP